MPVDPGAAAEAVERILAKGFPLWDYMKGEQHEH